MQYMQYIDLFISCIQNSVHISAYFHCKFFAVDHCDCCYYYFADSTVWLLGPLMPSRQRRQRAGGAPAARQSMAAAAAEARSPAPFQQARFRTIPASPTTTGSCALFIARKLMRIRPVFACRGETPSNSDVSTFEQTEAILESTPPQTAEYTDEYTESST